MRKIVYYVASSLDGFIMGPNNDMTGFVSTGDGLKQYLDDLQHFDTTIMGRKTYEFGYNFGLQPGQPAYPHMKHFIFSNSLTFENPHANVQVCKTELEEIEMIRNNSGTDIYLCGGGQFAGWLLDHNLIDILKIKLNPLILGHGTRMFGNSKTKVTTQLTDSNVYDEGLQIMTFNLIY